MISNLLRDFVSHLRFRVADDDIIIGNKEHIGNFTLRCEAFAGTGRTKNQTVGVLQELSVHHDQIIGQGIDTAVQRTFPVLEQLLRGKWHENRYAGSGHTPLNLNLIQS